MVCDSRARSRGDASITLFECHLELGNGAWLCDRHLVLRAFTGIPVRLVLWRPHNEFTSRDDDHHRAAVRTFLEIRARLCRLCLLLLDREYSWVHRHAPAILLHDFLCDGPWIDEADYPISQRLMWNESSIGAF